MSYINKPRHLLYIPKMLGMYPYTWLISLMLGAVEKTEKEVEYFKKKTPVESSMVYFYVVFPSDCVLSSSSLSHFLGLPFWSFLFWARCKSVNRHLLCPPTPAMGQHCSGPSRLWHAQRIQRSSPSLGRFLDNDLSSLSLDIQGLWRVLCSFVIDSTDYGFCFPSSWP